MNQKALRWLLAAALAGAASGAIAADKYGAIAFNKETRAFGYSFDHPSQAVAERRAVAECGAGCKSMAWFANGCGALAVSPNRYGTATGPSRADAERQARSRCGAADCKVLVQSCTQLPKKQ